MRTGVHFGQLRLIISVVAVLAQFYLFLRIGQVIGTWRRSRLGKSLLIGAVGLSIAALFAMNAVILSRPSLWVDPPEVADIILFYLPAVWTFGSICSALLLGLVQLLRGLGRVVRSRRSRSGPPEIGPSREPRAPPVSASRGEWAGRGALDSLRIRGCLWRQGL